MTTPQSKETAGSERAVLLPCPFCGRKFDSDLSDTLYPSGTYKRADGMGYCSYKAREPADQPCWSMNCTECNGGCGVEISADTEDEVIAKWNRRASQPSGAAGEVLESLRYWVEPAREYGASTEVVPWDELQKALASLASPSSGGWRPISEAPKDGSEFLAIWGQQGNVVQIVSWDKVHHHWQTKGRWIGGFEANATAWQPLPPAPKSSGESHE